MKKKAINFYLKVFLSFFLIFCFVFFILSKIGLVSFYKYQIDEYLDEDIKYFSYDNFNLTVEKCDKFVRNQFFEGIKNISWNENNNNNNSNLIVETGEVLNCIEKINGGKIDFNGNELVVDYSLKPRSDNRYAMCSCGKKLKFEIFDVDKKNIVVKFNEYESEIFENGTTKGLVKNTKMKVISQSNIFNISRFSSEQINSGVIDYFWNSSDELIVNLIFKLNYKQDILDEFDFGYDYIKNELSFRAFSDFYCPEEGDIDEDEEPIFCNKVNDKFVKVKLLIYEFDKRDINIVDVKVQD